MKIPKWKEAEMEKGKSTEAKQADMKRIVVNKTNDTCVVNRMPAAAVTSTTVAAKAKESATKTITMTTPTPAATTTTTALSTATARRPEPGASQSVFKIPLQVQQTSNRDPRLTKTITNSSNATNASSSGKQSHIVETSLPSNQNAPSIIPNNVDERKSVKDRLGARLPLRGIFSNLKNTTSFVIPNNLTLTPAESSAMANRVNKPIPSISIPMPSTENQQNAVQQPAPLMRPTIPAFAQTQSQRQQNDMQFIIPAFATGAQQYEPVFTHLFKTTCRYFMRDACLKSDCQLEHRLPDHIFFLNEIDKMFQASIIDLYENYMCRNQKLFDFYFIDFCQYFGKNGLVENLKQMVADCIKRKSTFHFTNIIDGLMMAGRSFVRATSELIQAVPYRNLKTSTEIIKLILNPRIVDIDPFVGVIDSIRQQEHFKFTSEWVNRLLIIHSQKSVINTEFNSAIFKLIDGLGEKGVKALNEDLLKKFLDNFALQG